MVQLPQIGDVQKIIEECGFFSKLGCGSVIVDDGWQTAHTGIGYAYCGDWVPHPSKVTDMKAFADTIHALGMKFILCIANSNSQPQLKKHRENGI